MSESNRFQQIPPCYGEAFEESFWNTLTFNDWQSFDGKFKDRKISDHYIEVPFVKENMIKSKFSTSKGASEESQMQSTAGEPTPRSFQKWGWLESDFGQDDSSSQNDAKTPEVKKAK